MADNSNSKYQIYGQFNSLQNPSQLDQQQLLQTIFNYIKYIRLFHRFKVSEAQFQSVQQQLSSHFKLNIVKKGNILQNCNTRCVILIKGKIFVIKKMNDQEIAYNEKLSQYGINNVSQLQITQMFSNKISQIDKFKIRKSFQPNNSFGYLEEPLYDNDILVTTEDSIILEISAQKLNTIFESQLNKINQYKQLLKSNLKKVVLQNLQQNQTVFIENQPSEYLFLIIQGRIQSKKLQASHLIDLGVIESPQIFGQEDDFKLTHYTAYVQSDFASILKLKKQCLFPYQDLFDEVIQVGSERWRGYQQNLKSTLEECKDGGSPLLQRNNIGKQVIHKQQNLQSKNFQKREQSQVQNKNLQKQYSLNLQQPNAKQNQQLHKFQIINVDAPDFQPGLNSTAIERTKHSSYHVNNQSITNNLSSISSNYAYTSNGNWKGNVCDNGSGSNIGHCNHNKNNNGNNMNNSNNNSNNNVNNNNSNSCNFSCSGNSLFLDNYLNNNNSNYGNSIESQGTIEQPSTDRGMSEQKSIQNFLCCCCNNNSQQLNANSKLCNHFCSPSSFKVFSQFNQFSDQRYCFQNQNKFANILIENCEQEAIKMHIKQQQYKKSRRLVVTSYTNGNKSMQNNEDYCKILEEDKKVEFQNKNLKSIYNNLNKQLNDEGQSSKGGDEPENTNNNQGQEQKKQKFKFIKRIQSAKSPKFLQELQTLNNKMLECDLQFNKSCMSPQPDYTDRFSKSRKHQTPQSPVARLHSPLILFKRQLPCKAAQFKF